MTEETAVTLPPPEADAELFALSAALHVGGPYATESILMSAAHSVGMHSPEVTVSLLARNIGRSVVRAYADHVMARLTYGSAAEIYSAPFLNLREHEETDTRPFDFLAEDGWIDFGFLEEIGALPTVLNAGAGTSEELGKQVSDYLYAAVHGHMRSEALLSIDRHFWRRYHFTTAGERVATENLRIPQPSALEAVAFFVATLTDITPHAFYRRTMERWMERIDSVWQAYATEIANCGNCSGEYFAFDGSTISGEDDEWCGRCRDENSFYCDSCEDNYHTDYMNHGPGDTSVCDTCRQERCWRCDCGELQWNDERCPDCSDYGNSDGSYGPLEVQYYSFKPEPLFFSMRNGSLFSEYQRWPERETEDDKIFFGMELETNIRSGGSAREGGELIYNSALVSGLGFIYAKSDCTVSGPELVTHPATLAAHRHLWAQFPFRGLTQHRWSGWVGSNAGCHIHIDRRAFRNKAHLARFQIYFGSWRDELVNFGGRNCSAYGHHGQSMTGASRAVAYATRRQYPARGSAINYENRATIEVRMFRASLREATVMAYLEFLHGLIHYSATHGSKHIMSENGLAFSTFAEWLNNNSNGNYDNAVTRITERVSA